MSFKDFVETEKNQIKTLIEQHKAEIERLENDIKKWDKKVEEEFKDLTSPGAVAADESATQEERTAAANQALSQDPQRVNAEQSQPSPSTHSEQFEKSDDEVKKEAEAKLAEERAPERVVGETQEAHDNGYATKDDAEEKPKKATKAKSDDKK